MRRFAAAIFALLFASGACAQNVTPLPIYGAQNGITDLGNGPAIIRVVSGSALLDTSSGTGTGSTSGFSTALTLTGTPTTPPCVGCVIAGAGITSGTTVAAYNGTTGITLSAAMTVPASTALSWGAACPSLPAATIPLQGSPAGDTPFYTYARVCAYPTSFPGAALLPLVGASIAGSLALPVSVANGGTGDTGTPWLSFTPTLTCGSATFTVNSATYKNQGKSTLAQVDFTISAIGSCTTPITFTAPNTAASGGDISGEETVNSFVSVNCIVTTASATVTCRKNANAVFAVNDRVIASSVYQNQ